MGAEGTDFSIHTRPSARGPVFYAQFKLDDGAWSNAKSTRILDSGKKKDREAATAWAQRYLDTGQIVNRETITFSAFSSSFFNWGGEWAQEKLRRGHRISQEQCEKHAQSLAKHLVPYFGKMRMSRIDDEHVRRFQATLEKEGLAGGTINRVTVALRVLLKAAYRKKMLRRLPIVEAVSEKDHKRRGVYLPHEIRAMFGLKWPDKRCFVMNKTAAATGLRASELTGLRESKIHPEYLEVEQRWSPRYMEGPTKTGRPRIVPIPSLVYGELAGLLEENPHPGEDRFVFYSVNPDRPMNQREATEALYVALGKIGIDEEARKSRGLDFHAWRHTFNSLLVDRRIPLQAVQSVTGHLSEEMTQRYYHLGGESGAGIRQIAESIFVEPAEPRTKPSGRKHPAERRASDRP